MNAPSETGKIRVPARPCYPALAALWAAGRGQGRACIQPDAGPPLLGFRNTARGVRRSTSGTSPEPNP
jgi:hypothetical protein